MSAKLAAPERLSLPEHRSSECTSSPVDHPESRRLPNDTTSSTVRRFEHFIALTKMGSDRPGRYFSRALFRQPLAKILRVVQLQTSSRGATLKMLAVHLVPSIIILIMAKIMDVTVENVTGLRG